MKPRTLLMAVVLAASVPATAQAQDASALYKKGVAAMAAGKLATACPMLEKSYEKEARLPTLFALAQCENKQNKSSTALDHYKAYVERVALASPADQQAETERKKTAMAQIEALEKTLPELTFVMPPNAPDGTIVKLDGRVAPFLSNVRVQPGEHVILLEVPDLGKVETKVAVASGEKKNVQLTLPGKATEPAAVAAAPAAPPPEAPKAEEAPPPVKEEPKPPPRPVSHTGAWIAAGVGVVGMGVGTAFGLMAISKSKTVEAHCLDVLCDAEGKKAGDQGKAFGWISTGGFALGAIAAGVSLYLFFSDSGSGKSASNALAPTKTTAWQPIVAGAELGTGGFVGARRNF
jgi:hypothetical protein